MFLGYTEKLHKINLVKQKQSDQKTKLHGKNMAYHDKTLSRL